MEGNIILENQNKSLKWFNFYTYIRLPLGIVLSLPALSYGGLSMIFVLVYIVFSGIVFWGLLKKTLWGYKLNFAFLIIEALALSLTRTENIAQFSGAMTVWALIWILPNWIYFKNRKYLFLSSPKRTEAVKLSLSDRMPKIDLKPKLKNAFVYLKKYRMVILIILILATLFYWFQLRPTQIKKECSSFTTEKYRPTSDNWQKLYNTCIKSKGL